MLDTKPLPPDLAVRRAAADALTVRRIIFAGLVLATILLLMGLATHALSAGGLDALDVVLLALFLVTLPWTVIGFWNAAIGFVIMRFAKNPAAAVTAAAGRIRGDEPITASVAVLCCIRNEPPARRQHGVQGGQHPRFLRAVRGEPRIRGDARR